MYLQLQGRADERQLGDPKLGMTHNLGGFPHQNVCGYPLSAGMIRNHFKSHRSDHALTFTEKEE